jgi:hypothetical protein
MVILGITVLKGIRTWLQSRTTMSDSDDDDFDHDHRDYSNTAEDSSGSSGGKGSDRVPNPGDSWMTRRRTGSVNLGRQNGKKKSKMTRSLEKALIEAADREEKLIAAEETAALDQDDGANEAPADPTWTEDQGQGGSGTTEMEEPSTIPAEEQTLGTKEGRHLAASTEGSKVPKQDGRSVSLTPGSKQKLRSGLVRTVTEAQEGAKRREPVVECAELLTSNSDSGSSSDITIGFLNMGGGTNPMEFLSASIEGYDKKFGTFMTSKKGIEDLLKGMDDMTFGDPDPKCIDHLAELDGYVSKKKEKLRTMPDGETRTAILDGLSKILTKLNPKAGELDRTMPGVPVSIFTILMLADIDHDLDAENQVDGCEMRYNPFNRAKQRCAETNKDDMQAEAAEVADGEDGENAKGDYAFVTAIASIKEHGEEKAFKTMFCEAAARHVRMKKAWAGHKKNEKEKGGKNADSDPEGVLFYDVYCAHFLCHILTPADRDRLAEHFASYLAPEGACELLKCAVKKCDVFGIAEDKATPRQSSIVKGLMPSKDSSILKGPASTDTSFVVDGSAKWNIVSDRDYAFEARCELSKVPLFVNPLKTAVSLAFAKTKHADLGGVTPEDVAAFRKKNGLEEDGPYAKLIKGVDGFGSKINYIQVLHSEGDTLTKEGEKKNVKLNVAIVHGKDYKECAKGLESASMINALMGLDSKLYAPDIVGGDLNVTFGNNKYFFASVLKLLREMYDKDDDYSEKNNATLRGLLESTIQFLDAKTTKLDIKKGEECVPFADDIRVIPIDTITTQKTRGFVSVQPNKIHKKVGETKDFVFYKRSKVKPVAVDVFPSSDAIARDTLNTGTWPMDHAGISVRFSPRPDKKKRE